MDPWDTIGKGAQNRGGREVCPCHKIELRERGESKSVTTASYLLLFFSGANRGTKWGLCKFRLTFHPAFSNQSRKCFRSTYPCQHQRNCHKTLASIPTFLCGLLVLPKPLWGGQVSRGSCYKWLLRTLISSHRNVTPHSSALFCQYRFASWDQANPEKVAAFKCDPWLEAI